MRRCMARDTRGGRRPQVLPIFIASSSAVRVPRFGVPLPGVPEGVPAQLEELGYLPQMETFALDLQRHRTPELGAAFGRSILDVVCAAYASAGRGGDWVPLPFEGPRDRTPLQLWRG